jgi:hypothetical protein
LFKFTRLSTAAAAVLLSVSALFAAADPTYTALRAARPDGRTIAVSNLVFDRDVYHFTLNGTLHLLAPVDGKTAGAVFRGQGAYTLTPVLPDDRHALAMNAGDDKLTVLSDTFDSAVFFDTVLLADAEKAAGAPKSGVASSDAQDVFNEYLKRQKKDLHTNLHVRILESQLNQSPSPDQLFLGWLKSKKYPAALVAVDPLGVESLGLGYPHLGGEQTALYTYDDRKRGFWYLSHLKSEIEKRQASVYAPIADGEHYVVDMTIASNADISGTTTMTFTNNHEGTRVVPLNLVSRVRLKDVSFAPAGDAPQWTPVSFIQEDQDDDADAAVVFPAGLKRGEKYLLKLTYSGGKEVLQNAGDGNYSVGARESWYPNVGTFEDTATFDLTFHIPQKMQIVAVGEEVSNTVSGNDRIAVWKAAVPLRVAGFNYGKFKKLSQSDKESGFTVDVYTNPGTPDIIREINQYLEAATENRTNGEIGDGYVGPSHVRVDTGSLAQSAMADGINTARTAKAFFGVMPQTRVSITQQTAWFSGQSWPQLIYLPYLAFLDGTTRNTLGLNGVKDFIDEVGPHEVAHQWWGHAVAPKTYHDEWISEGFSEFTAGLVLQQTGGWPAYNAFWERKRKSILDKGRGSMMSNDQAGPISQGFRLSTWQTPDGYDTIVYAKGAYVLHMLRMTMQDRSKKNPDEPFMEMMTDFAKSYAGKNVTTADFQHVVERHMSPSLKLTADGKADWFFQQWVYGTTIPRLTQKLDVADAGNGKYRITGTIAQSDVPDNFVVVVPIYVYFDKNAWARLGALTLVGNKSQDVNIELALPRKPAKIVANAMHDILTR